MIDALRKSVLAPWWPTVCVTLAVAFATVSQTPLSAPAPSFGEHAFDHVRKVGLHALDSAAKVHPRKAASEQRLQWLAWSGQIGVKPVLTGCYSTLTREKHRVVTAAAGTFRERAPPI